MELRLLLCLMLALILFSGCLEPFLVKETEGMGETEGPQTATPDENDMEKHDCLYECCAGEVFKTKECPLGFECKENKCVKTEEAEEKAVPVEYQIENSPYYREDGFCWGASAIMLMMHEGFMGEEIQEFRRVLKSGQGGPPDMFKGFSEFGVLNKVHIGYSKDYVKEYADFYNMRLLANPREQVVLFEDENQALEKLKKLVSLDILPIVVGHNGNHYMVVTGYDENYVYFNDPGIDAPFAYQDHGQQRYEEKGKMQTQLFIKQWNISGFEGGGVGFPGDYGMIWFGEEITPAQ